MSDDSTADEIETIAVNTAQRKMPGKKLLSPVKAGLLAGGAAAPLGPISLLVGLGTGVVQHFKQKNYTENETAFRENLASERAQLVELMNKEYEMADPDEKRIIDYARAAMTDGYKRLASGDPSGDRILADARNLLVGIMQGDLGARRQEQAQGMAVQRDLVKTAAGAYREEHQNTVTNYNQIQLQTDKIFDIVNDPNFDPNKPVNKAYLTDLLSMAGNMMFKDAPNKLDAAAQAIGGVSSTAGAFAGGVATFFNSDDFKVTKEDYNRLALNARKLTQEYASRYLTDLGERAKSLDSWSRKLKLLPDDMSLADYISGNQKELRLTPIPENLSLPKAENSIWNPTRGSRSPRTAPTQNLIPQNYTPVTRTRPTN